MRRFTFLFFLTLLSSLMWTSVNAQQYCAAAGSDTQVENITNVTFAGINNTTTTHLGYNDFTGLVAQVAQGEQQQLSVTINAFIGGGDFVYAFIDWNGNGILNDVGEVYTLATNTFSSWSYTLNVTAPNDAVSGNIRMRIIIAYDKINPDPCGNFDYGEVEDYTISITPPLAACPTGDFTFTTQAEIDAFGATYGHCTEIPGNVLIQGGDITNLDGLSALESIGGNLIIRNNSQLTNLDGLSNLTEIGGNLIIRNNSQLTNLDGLSNLTEIGGDLDIYNNSQLTNLDGLSALESINGYLVIYNNAVLTDISGLQNIDPATILPTYDLGLYIVDNPLLSVCDLDNFCTYLAGSGPRTISGNAGDCVSVTAVTTACTTSQEPQCPTGDVALYSQTDVNNFATNYPNCTEISGYLYISGSTITDLSPLSNLTSIGGYLHIDSNSSLTNLDGLSNLTSIGGYLRIYNNSNLTNLDGLSNLTQIGGYLDITYNSQLTNLDGLSNLTSIGADLVINSNYSLTDISGLQNIDPASILSTYGLGLYIMNNSSLSVCNLPNFCTYLQGSGPRTISGNAGDCISEAAVTTACIPACDAPTDVTATDITLESATLNWTSTGTDFDIEWGTADFTQGTGTQDTTTNTSYDLSNLEIGTSYDFYVRQNCSDNESNWVKYTFSTSDYCVPVPEWDSGDLGINIDSFTTTGGETNISNTNSGYSTNGYGNFSATHSVSQIAGEDISFSAVPGTQHWNKGLGIWVDWNNDGVFNNDSSEIVYVSPNVTIGTHNGSFSIPSDKQAGNYRMRVMIKYIYTTMDPCEITYGAPYYEYFYGETEDYTLTVLEVPPCEVPTAVTATDITLESAAINWTSTGNNFDIEWGTAGFTQGQGTTATTTTTSYALSNLTLGTSYDFYVRQNCSLNESDWVKHTFSTNNYCIPVPVANSGYYGVNISSFTTMGGETNISNIDSGFSTNGYGNFSATHSVSQIAGEDISFSAVPGESSLYEKGLRIWVDWNKDGVFNNDNSEIVYIYPNVITGTHNGSFSIPADKIADSYRMRVMIKYSSSNIDPCETNYGDSFYGETEDYTLTVLEVPPCDVPTAVTATDITLESATINWTSTGNNFDIEWGTADFTQGTGTTVTGITANSYSLTSLSSNTQYQFYVRQDCSVNESDWTGPFGFTTLLQCPTGDVTLYSQADVNNFATNYPNCTEITGYLYIGGSNITDLSPLNNIQSVGGYLNIESNSQLTNLDGLSNLTQIGGFLAFQSNDILENLDGLGNLTQIGGYLNIYYNSQLTNLDGLGNLTQIGGNLYITSNSQLTNLDGLSALESINGSLFIYDNPVLTDISGLQNIDPATILSTNGLGLYIQYNPLLSVCNLDNFCTYLAGDGERTISGNLGTCYDVDAVVAACNASVYDCPDLELNIGDTCTDADGNEGTVDEDCNCYVEPTPAVCEWTVHIWDNHWGDDVTWSLKDKEGNVLLQGGYYDLIYDDTQTVTTEGPLTFTISNVGEHNDNIPNYTVFNGTEILVEGQLTQPSMTLEFTDLNCYVAPTCSAEWTGAVSEDWNTAANWCDNTVPTAGSNVVINNSNLAIIDINTVVTIESITLGAAANVTVNGLLNVGDITVAAGGSLVIANDANLLQSETATNTGNITVKRNTVIKHLDYTIWSSPVADQELEAFSPNTLASRIYQYNTSTDAWEVTAENFTAGKGIMFRAPNLFDDGNYPNAYTYEGVFTGTPHNGDISVSFSQVGEYQGVGNPYPSNIKITGADGFWNTNPTVGTLYFWTNTNAWDTGTGDYVANNWATYSNLGGLAAANSTKVPVDIISVGQGFVIKTPGLSSISFNNGMRIAQNSVFFRTIEEDKHRLWLNLSDSSSELNNILIGYMDGATQGEDLRIDSKMFNYNGSALYSLIESNGFAYTIQGRSLPFDDFDVVPLGFRAITPGSFTVSLASFDGLFAQGQDIFLKDNLTQTQHNLKDSDYTFVSNQGEFTTRFEVVYRTSMNVTNPELSNAWTVYAKNKTFFIETQGIDLKEVMVYDMLGRVIYESQAQGNKHSFAQIGANQVLVIKLITTDNEVLTKKVSN